MTKLLGFLFGAQEEVNIHKWLFIWWSWWLQYCWKLA